MRVVALAMLMLLAFPVNAGGPSLPSSGPIRVTVLAVEETESGPVGAAADLEVNVLGGGSGKVFLSTKPLAETDFQGSARLAAQVAGSTLGVDWTKQDYLIAFRSGSPVIGGPSAGSSMTLALTVALHNLLHPQEAWAIDDTVASTGTINPDGTIGPVGGVPAKAEGAAASGIKTFLYPAGLDVAPAQQTTPQGLRTVQVDMARHCANLRITCRSVATLNELMEAAAHVRLATPDVVVPDTTGYAQELSPSVERQVDSLTQRIQAGENQAAAAGLSGMAKAQIDAQWQAARDELAKARDALAQQRYYGGATASFKGAIAAGRAENLTRFHVQDRSQSVVMSAIDSCAAATDAAAAAVNGVRPDHLNAVYAMGAAQDRVQEAEALLAQARLQHAQGLWGDSLFSSAFCGERAGTVHWWAGLRDLFPPGPPVPDLTDLAQTALDQAADLVSYAQAVLQGRASEAQARLDQANAHARAGRLAAVIVVASDAQSLASVAMQTGGGTTVPASVLAAAQQGAARAIALARAGGAEPMLSVSLVELAQGQDQGPISLQEYWAARNLALVQLAPSEQETSATRLPQAQDAQQLMLRVVVGLFVGVVASSLVVLSLRVRRPR